MPSRRPVAPAPFALKALVGAALCLAGVGTSPITAADYHVGPGQPLATIGDAPWTSLQPGDRVLIHWRDTPYREKWVLNRRGTPDAWISVIGVPGPQGQRPVISGDGAVTAPGLNFWNEQRGLIKIGGSNSPPDALPAYLRIEGLELRSARPPYTFTNDGGGVETYSSNAASIYVEKAEHLVIRDCVIHDSGNGIFVGVNGGQTQDLLIEGNDIFDNGISGSIFEHNTYTEAIGIVYQFNRFGALRAGAGGNNLKDRSAGLVVRYNWIEDGNRQLDLVDGGSSVFTHPSYGETFVYGNVLIEGDGEGNSQIAHYGGDGGDTGRYRKGKLYFFSNTVVSTRSGNTTVLRLSTQDESADVRNNVLYAESGGNRLAMLDATGDLTLRHNWTRPGWRDSHGTLTGTIDDDGSGVEGADPGFVDMASQSFRPAAGSSLIDAGTAQEPGAVAHPLLRQYLRHLGSEPRPGDAALDIGAWEFCPGPCAGIFADGFEGGDLGAWSP
ncbi:MAG: right-handed parallel beta-helix repeat-containing protein [Acidobacteriota bacterium]